MKNIRRFAAALLVIVLLTTTAFAADGGFNAGLAIDRSVDGKITVTVQHSSILAEKKPSLSIPCDYTYAKVTSPDGEVAYCTIENGEVTFTVAAGGSYLIESIAELPDNSGSDTPQPAPIIPPAPITPPAADDNTTTETTEDGTVIKTETKADGSSVAEATAPNGSTAITTTTADGAVSAEVELSAEALKAAADEGTPVALPIAPVEVPASSDTPAPVITVNTGAEAAVKVEVPVENVTAGTVAILVAADGTETVIKTTVPTENGIAVPLEDGAVIKIVDASVSFDDVAESDWHNDAVAFASSRNLFKGVSDTAFAPGAKMTSGMLMTVLARFDGADTTPAAGEHWQTPGVNWAVENGIHSGENAEKNITREEIALMLWKYAGSPDSSAELDKFHDKDSISSEMMTALRWAVENGIMQGVGGDRLNPKGEATRAHVAQFFLNFITKHIAK